VRLIALWDGKNERSNDLDVHLVKHMVDLMRETGGVIEQINPTKLTAMTSADPLEAVSTRVIDEEDEMKKPPVRRKGRTKRKK
jgi:hypothetical protein